LFSDNSTDTIQTHSVDEAISRMREAYKIGAEVGFVEGILNANDAKRIVNAVSPMPLLLNLATNGVTPNWTVEEGAKMGFKVFIFPFSGVFPVVHALRKSYKEVLEQGTDVKACGHLTPREFFSIVGLSDMMEIDKLAGSTIYKSV
jgi:2-methylisocitrate lyase-like PEP mutase family enzyme